MSDERETVLSARHVSKDFYLPHEKQNSLKSAIVNIFKKKDKEADTQHALKDISFDIKEGEFFGILGRNGSGKSTMLKIISEIYKPTKGGVSHKGKLVPFIELGVGFNPELSGRENVYLNGALLGFSRKEINARYEEIVRFAELEEFMDQKLKNYSSGMQVRLAFSVATHAEADILVVDEVLAVGDADFQRKCYDFFKSLKKTGKTVVFVTHDMNAVREYCDRAILINVGRISHEGDAELIANEYLKLFNKSATDGDGETTRWGNGNVKITKADIKLTDDSLVLDFTLQAGADSVKDVVLGYKLMTSDGNLVLGGNTLNASRSKSLDFTASESKHLTFTMPNLLGTATYVLSATVRLSDGITICDDWSNIKSFGNARIEGHYPIVAPATLEVT